MKILIDDRTNPEVIALVHEHLVHMHSISPPESTHALDISALRHPDIIFWCAWENGELLGFSAVKKLNNNHVELKSMRTAKNHLRKGVAHQLLGYIIEHITTKGYQQISLETGSMDEFKPARKLYLNFGFKPCEPFAEYVVDANSVFMTKLL